MCEGERASEVGRLSAGRESERANIRTPQPRNAPLSLGSSDENIEPLGIGARSGAAWRRILSHSTLVRHNRLVPLLRASLIVKIPALINEMSPFLFQVTAIPARASTARATPCAWRASTGRRRAANARSTATSRTRGRTPSSAVRYQIDRSNILRDYGVVRYFMSTVHYCIAIDT